MFSRSSSRNSLLSEGVIKRFEGRIYVANSTDTEWLIEILNNGYDVGSTQSRANTIGAHQVSQLSCVYIQEGSCKIPLIVKATLSPTANGPAGTDPF